jgi:predicted RNase H-like HicB family nuclease
MAAAPASVRLPYRLDEERVNGWVLARCEALDLVCQGATEDEAVAQLRDEATLLLSAAAEAGTLAKLSEHLRGFADAAAPAMDVTLPRLP